MLSRRLNIFRYHFGYPFSEGSAEPNFIAAQQRTKTRRIRQERVGRTGYQPIAATLKQRGADFAVVVVGPVEQSIRGDGVVVDRPRPGSRQGVIAAADDAGRAEPREAWAMNQDQAKALDSFDGREGSGFQKCRSDELGTDSPQAGFGEGTFMGPGDVANAMEALRVVETVCAAHTKMKSA